MKVSQYFLVDTVMKADGLEHSRQMHWGHYWGRSGRRSRYDKLLCDVKVDSDLITATAVSTLQTKCASFFSHIQIINTPSVCFDTAMWFLQFHAVFRSVCVYFVYCKWGTQEFISDTCLIYLLYDECFLKAC